MAVAGVFPSFRRIDWVIAISAFVLFAFGISAIYSVELSRGASTFVLMQKQVIAVALGVGIALVLARSNYHLLRNYARGLYLVGVVMMLAVLLVGAELNGAKGWFVIGNLFAVQPIEFMKFAFIVELARYFGGAADRRFGWREFVRSGVITGIPVVLLMLQPDLGGAMLLVGTWLTLCFFAGASWKYFGVLALAGVLAFAVGWFAVFEDYQRERVRTFIDPSRDPLVSGYNVAQAKIAIGAGGVLGRGLGSGSQSQLRFLPEAETDFVFAVIAEELGFLGVAVVFAALLTLLLRLIAVARTSTDTFAAYLVLGIAALLGIQAFVHVAANLSMLPATGVSLPFVSYGGSSLLLSCLLLGVAESVAITLTPGIRR